MHIPPSAAGSQNSFRTLWSSEKGDVRPLEKKDPSILLGSMEFMGFMLFGVCLFGLCFYLRGIYDDLFKGITVFRVCLFIIVLWYIRISFDMFSVLFWAILDFLTGLRGRRWIKPYGVNPMPPQKEADKREHMVIF